MSNDETVLIWAIDDKEANDLLRQLASKSKYKWVRRKLDNARWHLIHTHTEKVPYESGCEYVMNGQVPEWSEYDHA